MKHRTAVVLFISLSAPTVFHSAPHPRQTAEESRSVWDAVYTKEQAKRGEALYSRECASCHGDDLIGNEEATPLAGPAFLANWDGLTIAELSERTRVSMPPNDPGRLSRRQIADILAYMMSANGFPPGKKELDSKTELLKLIRIEATRPSKDRRAMERSSHP